MYQACNYFLLKLEAKLSVELRQLDWLLFIEEQSVKKDMQILISYNDLIFILFFFALNVYSKNMIIQYTIYTSIFQYIINLFISVMLFFTVDGLAFD